MLATLSKVRTNPSGRLTRDEMLVAATYPSLAVIKAQSLEQWGKANPFVGPSVSDMIKEVPTEENDHTPKNYISQNLKATFRTSAQHNRMEGLVGEAMRSGQRIIVRSCRPIVQCLVYLALYTKYGKEKVLFLPRSNSKENAASKIKD